MSDAESVHSTEVNENELTPVVVTKYQTAADIVNRSLTKLLAEVKEGKTVYELCVLGDNAITELSKTVYNKGKIPKGIAFPTCVSTGSAVVHLSPLESDPEASIALKNGDVVRIMMGAHVDGYISQVAHTLVVGATKETPVTGRTADVLQAAYTAIEVALRSLKPGNSNFDVTDRLTKTISEFDCKGVEGMLSHTVTRNAFDGVKAIILNPTDSQRKEMETFEVEEGHVFGLDVLVSSGEGKTKPLETRTTVYKRNAEATYQLKMKTSRAVFSQITKDHGTMAFSLRQLDDEKKARMGIVECANHGLIVPFDVLHEKEDSIVAHFMCTVLVMKNGPLQVTTFPFDQELVKSEKKVEDKELVDLLAEPVRANKKNKKKKKAATDKAE